MLDILGREPNGVRELWIATRKAGIYRWRTDGWKHFTADGVSGDWRVFSIIEQIDRAERSWLWAGTNQGVARFDGANWQLLHDVPGLGARSYLGLSFPVADPTHQVLWIGTEFHGLVRLDVTEPVAPLYATISAGVATVAPESEDDIHHLLRVADLALYRAMDEGRNRVRS